MNFLFDSAWGHTSRSEVRFYLKRNLGIGSFEYTVYSEVFLELNSNTKEKMTQ